mmetsp:Transcript_35273/g.112204  ORF Transcript_35273/g.112204 Transcript_35273/m.112204 type:complete len:263 (-) Transcript_35273:151-939(-)
MRLASVPSAGETHSKGGGGLPRQRLESVHVAFRIMDDFSDSRNTVMMGLRPPLCSTRSLKFGESPAMFPRAHTACSRTSSLGDCSSITKMGRAPCSTTTRVCSAVPEAMLVSTQAASNCRSGLPTSLRNTTRRGTIPAPMTSWIGGLCSMLRSFRNCCVALNCACGSSDISIWHKAGSWSSGQAVPMPMTAATGAWPFCMAVEELASPPGRASGNWPCGMALTMRFFCSASSRVSFRNCTVASSRFRRASSASTPFLKAFCR